MPLERSLELGDNLKELDTNVLEAINGKQKESVARSGGWWKRLERHISEGVKQMTTRNKENVELPRHKRELTTEGFEVTKREG